MNRNYSETSMISIPADKNNKAIILDVGGKKHKIRGELIELTTRSRLQLCQAPRLDKEKEWTSKKIGFKYVDLKNI